MGEIGVVLFILGGLCLPIGIVVWIVRAIMKKSTTKNMKFTCISMAAIIIGFALVVMSPTEESTSVTNEVISNEEEKMELADMEKAEDSSEYLSEEIDAVIDEEMNITESSPDIEGEIVESTDVQTEEVVYEEETNNSILMKYKEFIYPLSEFPYENKKMSKKAMKLYEEAMEAEMKDFICLEEISEGGVIKEKVVHYKKTIDEYNAPYRYYGKLNKNSEPDGMGIIIENWGGNVGASKDGYGLTICYIGEFKDGYKDGYGITYDNEIKNIVTVKYEGDYKEGKYEGEGTLFLYVFEEDCSEIVREWAWSQMQDNPGEEYNYLFEGYRERELYTFPVSVAKKEYSGEFKDGKFHGEGKSYFGADENNQPYLVYEGEFAEGKYEGKGKEYHYDGGNLKYEGEFKNGEYHGKGTLYDEQGNVKHKGKFKSGEVE